MTTEVEQDARQGMTRREFVKILAASPAALALPALPGVSYLRAEGEVAIVDGIAIVTLDFARAPGGLFDVVFRAPQQLAVIRGVAVKSLRTGNILSAQHMEHPITVLEDDLLDVHVRMLRHS